MRNRQATHQPPHPTHTLTGSRIHADAHAHACTCMCPCTCPRMHIYAYAYTHTGLQTALYSHEDLRCSADGWVASEAERGYFFFGACRRRTPMGCGVSKGCQYRKVLDERHLQIGAGPRHSPSACPEIPVKKDPCSGLDALVGGLMHEPRSDQPHTVAGWCSLCFSEVADQSYSV